MTEIESAEKSQKRKKNPPTAEAERPFEDALRELEQLAAQLERGDLSLDDAVAAYDKGIELSKLCRKKLDEAEGKIQQLSKEAGLRDFLPENLDE